MSSSVGLSGRLGLVSLFSVLVLLLSLLNLSGAAPLPLPAGQDTTAGTQFGQFFSTDVSLEEAMASFESMALSPEDVNEASATLKDELNKAKAGQSSMFDEPAFQAIDDYDKQMRAMKQMAIEQKPTDPGMSDNMLALFGGDSVDTAEAPGAILYDAANDGATVSDDATSIKKANPGLVDRFSLFGKSKQLVRWVIASMQAVKARIAKSKTANQPLTHDAQLSSLHDVVTQTTETQDAAAMSYAENEPFVILHDDAGANFYKQSFRTAITRMASVRQTFRPISMPKGATSLKMGLKLNTQNLKFDQPITSDSDPAIHINSQPTTQQQPTTQPESPVSPLTPTDPNAPVDPNEPQEPVSPLEPTDPNAPTDPNDPNKPKPKPGKPTTPAKPPKA